MPGIVWLRLAMSLDGFIADDDGGYGWIQPVPSPDLDTEHQIPFDDFLDEIDVVVMGRRCYDEGAHRDYGPLGKEVLVGTSRPPEPVAGEEHVVFSTDPVADTLVRRTAGERCLLFGGGLLVASFLEARAVDRFTVNVVPVLLGSGRPLFGGHYDPLELRLIDYTVGDSQVRMVYEHRARR
ncbi:dihydrofolate reductase family protein [Nocardioides mangrovi]|uniref:Dihydrofolate reductase family protein n=1 Tax=Nocardioides mangrovi TaxID=2874580 RepID=A0ABS7U8F2_9ACTN|nr:dihydrofolate reductase family protein [Nocardioides mangrovi]MBZ5737159.1 dihydrofolate reductase family protein [Nocardioides mangrovi]